LDTFFKTTQHATLFCQNLREASDVCNLDLLSETQFPQEHSVFSLQFSKLVFPQLFFPFWFDIFLVLSYGSPFLRFDKSSSLVVSPPRAAQTAPSPPRFSGYSLCFFLSGHPSRDPPFSLVLTRVSPIFFLDLQLCFMSSLSACLLRVHQRWIFFPEVFSCLRLLFESALFRIGGFFLLWLPSVHAG